jgi:hypothetical protein
MLAAGSRKGSSMRSIKKFRLTLAVAAAITIYAGDCFAIPTLQLNIAGGTYDSATQTVVAPTNTASNIFKLYAYLIEDLKHGDLVSDMYYISMAIGPQLSSPRDLGSFVFSGQTVAVSSGMTYGTPPMEGLAASKDHGDLSSHGVFPTYFAEWAFTFNPSTHTQAFNTEENPGLDPTLHPEVGRPMFYKEFAVDVSNLDPGYAVHFDLYSKGAVGGNVSIKSFAPYSHDAEGRYHDVVSAEDDPESYNVPEANSALLLFAGLVAIGVARKRHSLIGK